jgi:hypothetical protein
VQPKNLRISSNPERAQCGWRKEWKDQPGGGVLLAGRQALDALSKKTVNSRHGVVSTGRRMLGLVSYDTRIVVLKGARVKRNRLKLECCIEFD